MAKQLLTFERDGAAHHPNAAVPLLPALDRIAAAQPQHRAGTRLHGIPDLTALLTTGPIYAIAAAHIGEQAHPVRAILFDKTATANWSLGWHQDRTVAVRARHDLPGFGPWTLKQGILHVAPPFAVIAGMATLRIHLDDVPQDNAPLLIALGSHRALVAESEIDAAVARHGTTPASHDAATSGRIRPRSFTPPPPLPETAAAVSCRSITPPYRLTRRLSGLGCDAASLAPYDPKPTIAP